MNAFWLCQDKSLWIIAIDFSAKKSQPLFMKKKKPYSHNKFFRFGLKEISDEIIIFLSCVFDRTHDTCKCFSHYVKKFTICNFVNVKHMCLTINTWYNLYLTYLIYAQCKSTFTNFTWVSFTAIWHSFGFICTTLSELRTLLQKQ